MPAFSLPTHHFTGLRAIGVLPSGRVIWPVLGGSGEGDGGGPGSGSGSGSDGAGDGGGQNGSGGNNDGGQSSDRTFTQAELDRIVSERLGRERGKYADYDQLKAAADELATIKEAQATETEKALKAAAKETEARVRGEIEPQMLRLEIALAKGLPEELGKRVLSAAKRLVGSTREELEADAGEYFTAFPIAAVQTVDDFGQGARGGGGTDRPTLASGADLYAQRHKTT
jgi:hypothetical protein